MIQHTLQVSLDHINCRKLYREKANIRLACTTSESFYLNRTLTVFINPLEDDSDEITLSLLVKMSYGCVI